MIRVRTCHGVQQMRKAPRMMVMVRRAFNARSSLLLECFRGLLSSLLLLLPMATLGSFVSPETLFLLKQEQRPLTNEGLNLLFSGASSSDFVSSCGAAAVSTPEILKTSPEESQRAGFFCSFQTMLEFLESIPFPESSSEPYSVLMENCLPERTFEKMLRFGFLT